MKIELNLDVKPIKKKLYRLNPSLKKKIKEETKNMFVLGLIFLDHIGDFSLVGLDWDLFLCFLGLFYFLLLRLLLGT
jgi:hypothetical protein